MSARVLTFHDLAEQELNDAASYYEQQGEDLGRAFLDEVERAIAQIIEHPESAPRVNQTVRRMLVRRFPYSVMYSLPPNRIRILAIANQRRRPHYWHGRQ